MTSDEHEPITGVWGQSPQRVPRAEPLVRGSGGRSPLKLKAFWSLDVQRSRQIQHQFAPAPPRLRRLWYGSQSVGLVTNKVHCKLQKKEK